MQGFLAARVLIAFRLAVCFQTSIADSDADLAVLPTQGNCMNSGLGDEASLLQRTAHTGSAELGPVTTTTTTPYYHAQVTIRPYPVPGASQTHEMTVMFGRDGSHTLLVSQITSSRLVLMPFNDQGMFREASSFEIGTAYSGLHGLSVSDKIHGDWGSLVEMTLQFANKVILVNVSSLVGAQPNILQTIDLAVPHEAPHRTTNLAGDIWVTCKESQSIARIEDVYSEKKGKWHTKGKWHYDASATYKVRYYSVQAPGRPPAGPIFVDPLAGKIYATLDKQGKIARIDPKRSLAPEAAVRFIDLPADCPIPVGMTGKVGDPALWFTCGAQHTADGVAFGTGTFGRLSSHNDTVAIFGTRGKGSSTAAYLHLAWGPDTTDGYPTLYLLSSSIFDEKRLQDGLARAIFDPSHSKVLKSQWMNSITQSVLNHRVIAVGDALFVDGTASSVVVSYHQVSRAYKDYHDPNSDYAGSGSLSSFHSGLPAHRVVYHMEGYDPMLGRCK